MTRGVSTFRPARFAIGLLLAILPAALSQCGNGADEPAGALEIRVKDHREAIDDFESLQLTIDALRLSPDPSLKTDDPGWLELTPSVRQFDLTRYKDGDSLSIYEGEQEPRQFAALDFSVGKVEGILAKTKAHQNVSNHIRPVRIAFATQPGLEVAVVLDLEVVDMSDHPGRGYELHVRGYELFAGGELVERVPPG